MPTLVPGPLTEDWQDQFGEELQNLLNIGTLTTVPPTYFPVYTGVFIYQVVQLTGDSFKLIINKHSPGHNIVFVRNTYNYVDDLVGIVYRIHVEVTEGQVEWQIPVELIVSEEREQTLDSEVFTISRILLRKIWGPRNIQ